MRAVSILLLILSLLAVGNALVAAFHPPYKAVLREFRSKVSPEFSQSAQKADAPASVGLRPEDAQLAASIERMTAGIDALVATTGTGTPQVNASGSVVLPLTKSGSVVVAPVQPVVPLAREFPLSGALLARLMPDLFPKKIENHGIFDIHLFRDIEYSTYQDEKSKVKFYQFAESYDVMLSNLKLVSGAYAIKESDTYFDSTFFLNSTNVRDTTVRFVTELEGKALGVEVPKAQYPKLKKLLLQK